MAPPPAEPLPGLKELVVQFNAEVASQQVSQVRLNQRRVDAVEDAIKAIEAATTQPELRTILPAHP